MYRFPIATLCLILHVIAASGDDEVTTAAVLTSTTGVSSTAEVTDVAELISPTTDSTLVIERSSHHHQHGIGANFHGFWKKKLVWRPRWVKTWQEKKIYVAVWKRMWGPMLLNEWLPIPKPPPGWIKYNIGGFGLKKVPY